MRRLVYAVAFLLACSNAASADVRIEARTGGNALSYLASFESLREPNPGNASSSGPLFVRLHSRLDVQVRSRKPGGQYLAFMRRKVLDRCGNQYPAEAHETTRAVAASYPAPIRDWIRRHGGVLLSKPTTCSPRPMVGSPGASIRST
jgi:hypothetical protein